MIIPSIDIQDGQAVQLIGGRDKAIDGGDPLAVAERFALVGELCVIDLDAAMGRGDNAEVIRELLRRYPCRVGGGIRSVEAALGWLDAGATQVILGTAAQPELLRELPPERVIVALDAVRGEVVVEGWQTRTGQRVEDRIAELRELCGGFLLTFVELEGRLGGTDLARAEALVAAAGGAKVTIAGGVTTAEEVAALDRLGADAQVGMALYNGQLALGDAVAALLSSDRDDGLWPTVVTDERGIALGLAYSDTQSLRRAVDERRGIYRSRSRGLWVKGESSGATQRLLRVDVDCDRDTLRFVVRPESATSRDLGFCHLDDRRGCFSGALPGGGGFGPEGGLAELTRRLAERHADAPAGSYSARLFSEPELLAAKLREEADELAEASERAHVIEEAADVLFFACAKLQSVGASLADVEDALSRRQRRVRRRSQHEPGAGEAKPPREAATEETAPRAPLPLRRVDPAAIARELAPAVDAETLRRAGAIVDAVADEGEPALRRLAVELGDLADAQAPLRCDRSALEAARDALPAETRELLERTAARIRRFAEAQRESLASLDVPIPGGRAGHEVRPVAVAGCYAPGGRFPLPSTVLMTAVTARVAGVEQVIVASPRPTMETRAAAAIAGADALLCVGGAQAIAALAHGVGGVPACDVIVGPGNRWVTAAKQLLCGQVGIDMLAGPTELLVIADGEADPGLVAADLLAQAEHDVDARPVLISESAALLDAVDRALAARLDTLSTRQTAAQALARQGFCVLVETLEASVSIAEQLAPEHLQLSGPRAEALAPRLSRYGALFCGEGSAEVLGDYGAGPNHTLPTGGTARFRGGLAVFDFLTTRTWLRIDEPGAARELYDDAAALGAIEGLVGHRAAALARLGSRPPRR